MKPLFIAFILLLSGCGPEIEPNTDPQLGCLTGVPKDGGEREFIRCSTRGEVLRDWYKWVDYEWTPVSDCSECQ